uniref:Secreted protein n=1 Tax=Pyxicephalus adspersus TaxID=30357 RepID=A0AAV3A540_PYXAD|nr:TPA: hypothetical protein GDO54_010484 [Pyxicephalus adspersus]
MVIFQCLCIMARSYLQCEGLRDVIAARRFLGINSTISLTPQIHQCCRCLTIRLGRECGVPITHKHYKNKTNHCLQCPHNCTSD